MTTTDRRQLALQQREAYNKGWQQGVSRYILGLPSGADLREKLAAEAYPLPKVTRQRVITSTENGYQFRLSECGKRLQKRNPLSLCFEWYDIQTPYYRWGKWLARVYADLLENPTEEVEL